LAFVVTLAVLLAGNVAVARADWLGSSSLHTLIEAVACVVAMFTGVLALVRFYSRKCHTILLIGVGFLGTSILDGYHAVVTSSHFADFSPSSLSSLIPWSWTASRIYLSAFLAGSWLAWNRTTRLGERGRIGEVSIYLCGIVLTAGCFLFFALVPLPSAYFPGLYCPRPEEFLPAVLFAIALVGFLNKQHWRWDAFESWLVQALVVSVAAQALYMSRSGALFDGFFDAAHVLKIISYLLVCVGLLASVFETYGALHGTKKALESANEELGQQVEEAALALQRAEDAELQLVEVAGRLAMPPQALGRTKPYRLADFSLTDMIDCGAAIRYLSQQHRTERDFTNAVVRMLYEQFLDEEGQPEFALVRLFQLQRYDELSPSLQALAQASIPGVPSDANCLVLTATAGDRVSWCDVSNSRSHQVIPLPSAAALEGLPMIAALLGQLGIEVGGVTAHDSLARPAPQPPGFFHVQHARNSPIIPAQKEFVVPCGIKSVVAFGDAMPDGRMFAVIGFAKHEISESVAQLMAHLSFSAKMGLLVYRDGQGTTLAQVQTLGNLLSNHERIVLDQDARLRQAIATVTSSNSELEQFAYVASHDLQEPLRKISCYAQLIREDYGAHFDTAGHKYLDVVIDGANRLKVLVSDLLSLSRITTRGKPLVPTSADDCLALAIANLEVAIEESEARILVEPLPEVLADDSQLTQLFQNLIGNSIKYCDESVPEVRVGARPLGRQVEFFVQDNGIGIEPQFYQRIFEIFQRLHNRREYSGTGIGLAICKRIIERFGGQIRVESVPGEGSTFYFTIRPAELPAGKEVRRPELQTVGTH
jgi:signal transduction histidine kinase